MSENYTDINITEFPITVAESLSIDLWAGKLICSAILILIFLIPITMIVKTKHSSWIPECAITLVVMGICISLDWLPIWIFIVFCALMAMWLAVTMRKMITGGGGGE